MQGIEVGKSLVEEEFLSTAEEILRLSAELRVPLILPSDAVVASELSATAKFDTVPIDKITKDVMGLDIGPATLELFRNELANSGTIVWNGPMGVFEIDQFSRGTSEVAKILAELTNQHKTITIVGGGDSVAAVHKAGVAGELSHISTGGGASLELLEGKELPGVAALENR